MEREGSGCSHSYEHNFISKISKGKKQLVYVGGIAGGHFDHWVVGGVRFAGDQWGDSGGEEGGGVGDGGIGQDSRERLLCGVLAVSIQQRKNGFEFFKFDEHNQHERGEFTKYTRDCVSGDHRLPIERKAEA